MSDPSVALSVVVLSWNQLDLTKKCVESLRAFTDTPYELIVVDNGSSDGSGEYARLTADLVVAHESNLGFAVGMNSGLAVARGEFVAFVNNDTQFPAGWASTLLSNFESRPGAGIVVPAVTAAGNPVTVRASPGDSVEVLAPFGELPSGVVYVMPSALIRDLGGWNEAYRVATSEDLDLCFTVWTNDLEVVLDTRVLVNHVSKGSLATRPDRDELWRTNLNQFLDRWQSSADVVRLVSCSEETHARNRLHARVAAGWLRRLVEARVTAQSLRQELAASQPRDRAGSGEPRLTLRQKVARWLFS